MVKNFCYKTYSYANFTILLALIIHIINTKIFEKIAYDFLIAKNNFVLKWEIQIVIHFKVSFLKNYVVIGGDKLTPLHRLIDFLTTKCLMGLKFPSDSFLCVRCRELMLLKIKVPNDMRNTAKIDSIGLGMGLEFSSCW